MVAVCSPVPVSQYRTHFPRTKLPTGSSTKADAKTSPPNNATRCTGPPEPLPPTRANGIHYPGLDAPGKLPRSNCNVRSVCPPPTLLQVTHSLPMKVIQSSRLAPVQSATIPPRANRRAPKLRSPKVPVPYRVSCLCWSLRGRLGLCRQGGHQGPHVRQRLEGLRQRLRPLRPLAQRLLKHPTLRLCNAVSRRRRAFSCWVGDRRSCRLCPAPSIRTVDSWASGLRPPRASARSGPETRRAPWLRRTGSRRWPLRRKRPASRLAPPADAVASQPNQQGNRPGRSTAKQAQPAPAPCRASPGTGSPEHRGSTGEQPCSEPSGGVGRAASVREPAPMHTPHPRVPPRSHATCAPGDYRVPG
jgi:hypothetical protein